MNSPNHSILSPILERSLKLTKNRQNVKYSIYWCATNVALLSLLLYDIYNTTVYSLSYIHYIEYSLTILLSINVIYYFTKIITTPTKYEQILITKEQKVLLGIKDGDTSFKVVDQLPSPLAHSSLQPTPTNSYQNSINTSSLTPPNASASSWRSSISQNESLNYSLSSPSWTYHQGSPLGTPERNASKLSSSQSPAMWLPQTGSSTDTIKDEKSLNQYLKNYENVEKINNLNTTTQQSANLLSSFWSHPVTKTAKDMSMFLKKCQYQLSSQSPGNSASGSPKAEDKSSPMVSQTAQSKTLEVWTRINVDTVALTQWNENLRKWMSQTILERLVLEFDRINEALEKQYLTDIKIGSVGLDRLRKTAQMMPVVNFIPSLATVIPFLEVHSNQEYLVKRIKELAKGGCMSEFKWNSGSSHNSKEWDDSLPTDCAIMMHIVASYLDTQLMPVPNMPDTKPFSGRHYLKTADKLPQLTSNSIIIQEISEKPPHYRVIIGENMYEMIKGYNNLFHSILYFLYNANKIEGGMLGRVNLGRAGINMLWIIGQD